MKIWGPLLIFAVLGTFVSYSIIIKYSITIILFIFLQAITPDEKLRLSRLELRKKDAFKYLDRQQKNLTDLRSRIRAINISGPKLTALRKGVNETISEILDGIFENVSEISNYGKNFSN